MVVIAAMITTTIAAQLQYRKSANRAPLKTHVDAGDRKMLGEKT